MKNTLFLIPILLLFLLSCGKKDTCKGGSLDGTFCFDCKDAELEQFQKSCTNAGGKAKRN